MNMPVFSRTNGNLKDTVPQKLLKDRIITLAEFQTQTGSKNPTLYGTYLVAHGIAYGLRNKSGQPDIAHYFGSANSWLFRQNESGLSISDGGVAELLVHDVPEEVAKKNLARGNQEHALAAAYVVIDVLAHLLQQDASLDMRHMLTHHTNMVGIVYSPVKDDLSHVVKARGSDIQLAEVVSGLEKKYGRYGITARRIGTFYDMFIERLERMIGSNEAVGIIDQDVHRYLSPDDREFIRSEYRKLVEKAKQKKDDMMSHGEIEDIVATEFKRARDMISREEILSFDEPLLEPHPSRMLFRIGQTLYAVAYIQHIADEITKLATTAQLAGYPNGDSYLALGVNKSLDGRDSASRMLGTDLPTHASIYAKHKGSNIPKMAEVARRLAELGIPNEALLRSARFHLSGLTNSVGQLRSTYARAGDINTDYAPFLTLSEYMHRELGKFAPLSGIKSIPFNVSNPDREGGLPEKNMFGTGFKRTKPA